MATYTKVKLQKGSEYTGVGAWKPKDGWPANLLASSMAFDLNVDELKSWKYRISFWKSDKKTDKSPDGNFMFERVDEEAQANASASSWTADFSF